MKTHRNVVEFLVEVGVGRPGMKMHEFVVTQSQLASAGPIPLRAQVLLGVLIKVYWGISGKTFKVAESGPLLCQIIHPCCARLIISMVSGVSPFTSGSMGLAVRWCSMFCFPGVKLTKYNMNKKETQSQS